MRSLWIIIPVVLIVVVLFLSNPDTEAFAARYADRINTELAQDLDLTGPVGQLLGGVSQSLIADALEEQTRRDNYLVASVFTLPQAGEDLRVLGVAGRFISLNQ